jgi:hypothetical protein
LPSGDIVGWKKCRNDVLVKLRIPAVARRSHAFSRKCRAEFADVLEVIPNGMIGVSFYDEKFTYIAGLRVTSPWSEDWTQECSGGIHFYITREEAEAHE